MELLSLSKHLLPVVIGLIMFNLGLSLYVDDFKRIFQFPKALLIGLACQMLLLPLIAFGIASAINLSAEIKIGIVLIAACPGGATSNLISYLLKGNVALSIALTSINSILILFSIPGITFLALYFFAFDQSMVFLPFLPTVFKIFLMILLPTAIGLFIKYKWSEVATVIEKRMKYITTILLAVVFTIAIFDNNNQEGNSFGLYLRTLPFALSLNFIAMLSSFVIGNWARFDKKTLITLVIEVGIQNSALAITIATSSMFLNNSKMAVPAITYGIFTFFSAAIAGYIIKRKV